MSYRDRLLTSSGHSTTFMSYTPDDEIIFRKVVHNGPVLDSAVQISETVPKGHDGMRHIGVLPADVLDKIMTEGWTAKQLRRWLDENPKFKTHDDSADPRANRGVIVR